MEKTDHSMTAKRKNEHIDICLNNDIEYGESSFALIETGKAPFPEIDFDRIDTSSVIFGKELKFPLIIEAITGGTEEGKKINKGLASIALEYGIGFGVGSQRAAIENENLAGTFYVRDFAPDILLIANLGAVQLNYGFGLEECKKAVEMIKADVLALHINPFQEIIQPEGNRNFSGIIEKINHISRKASFPVIAKFIDTGVDLKTAKKIKTAGIVAGGRDGTNFCFIEKYRSSFMDDTVINMIAGAGLATAESIINIKKANFSGIRVASGGIRTGCDAAKSLVCGADLAAIALPVLKALASGGKEKVGYFLDKFIFEFKTFMFINKCRNLKELKKLKFKYNGRNC